MTDPEHRDTIVRYTLRQRTNHWLIAMSFVLAALSGLAMFHPSMFWLSTLFGGGPWTRILHPMIGVFMFIAFVLFAAGMWKDNWLQKRDWQWLGRIREVVNNQEEGLPEVGRYNAGQKLLYFAIVACMLGLIVSGIVIWRAYFSLYFPIGIIRATSVLHAVCAAVLICAIIVHIYSAFWIKGSVHAMTRGTVTPGWAWKHHRAWFREMTRATHSRSERD